MIEKKGAMAGGHTGVDLDFTVASAIDLVGISEEEVGALGYGALRHLVEAMVELASNTPSPAAA